MWLAKATHKRVVSYWNSTSNHNNATMSGGSASVVSYWNSTSNHNAGDGYPVASLVVSYWNSTSNHNYRRKRRVVIALYLIEILHQTTTCLALTLHITLLYLIEILHQTTTATSEPLRQGLLYLIEILHQTTTFLPAILLLSRCILLKFYIKPQQSWG